ncbi:MAG: hypothetical protein HYX84_04880 [Chloroflexi bacterium]|nr:hypothetical protein [Chloroflexota bacterium]
MNYPEDATSRTTVTGRISDRNEPNRLGREIVLEKAESRKLSIKDYPLTHKAVPEGLEVIAITVSHQAQCQASFHRYPEGSRYGESAYIGSATRRLKDRSQAKQFRLLLQQTGVDKPGTLVNLDFVRHGNVIKVYVYSPAINRR